jgi:beta-xylosidase
MSEGATFPYIEPSNSLAARFSTLWYTNDMSKQWQSNVVFHANDQQLKVSIETFPRMTPHTLHQYQPFAKFHIDQNFIYIIVRRDESKEELQSYYKLTDGDMEQIMKEWPKVFLVLVDDLTL